MAKPTHTDEILYCARCGISFLWAQEEQRLAGATQPLLCPGCRHLLPPPGRERGQIKWFDRRKQYGFVVRAGQPELYLHRSELLGRRVPAVGDLVEFAVAVTHKGPQAVEAVLLSAPPSPAGP